MFRRFVLLATILVPVGSMAAQETPFRKIFSSDTMDGGFPTVSPDGKWLLFIVQPSNSQSHLMIRPLAGGEPRVLPTGVGSHFLPEFSPLGDRIVFGSTWPRRDAMDSKSYLVSAPFDTRTGTLSAPPRQLSLDGLLGGMGHYAISPDGRSVAYVSASNAIRIIPVTGGNARTLTTPTARPMALAWSSDGRAIFYNGPSMASPGGIDRMGIAIDGGEPVVALRSKEPLGILAPDNQFSFSVVRSGGRSQWPLRILGADGQLVGAVPIPSDFRLRSVAGGKYLVGTRSKSVAAMKLAPVAGGTIRQVTDGSGYDWPAGWSANSQELHVALGPTGDASDSNANRVVIVDLGGRVKNRLRLPEGWQNDDYVVYKTPGPPLTPDSRLVRMSIKDGSTKELTGPIVARCCDPVGAGGMYYGLVGNEFYYRVLSGDRMRVMAMTMTGASRLLGEFPASRTGDTRFSVFRDRLAYLDVGNDSLRLRMTMGPSGAPKTLDAFPPTARGEFAWSHDGRQLFLTLNAPQQQILLYQFDAAGTLLGSPRTFTLPFEYWYEVFWLPDGSGLTMIAQPRGMPMTHVALVRLADPEHPVLLTRDDPNNKWGHALSPDGKYVAYPSHKEQGSEIYLIEVTELLKRLKSRP